MNLWLIASMVVASGCLAVAVLQARAALIARARADEWKRNAEHLEEQLASYDEARDARARAEARATELEKQLAEGRALLKEAEFAREAALKEANTAQKQRELAIQQLDAQEDRMKDWEAQKEESIRTAQAAIMKAGGDLSSKLLEDFKREAEEKKKENEQALGKTTGAVLEQFEKIAQIVGGLKSQTDATGKMAMTMWKTLSSPGGAGHLAEVGLENSLKGMGLEAGRDFFMQLSLDGGNLRPDAVIRLPQNTVLVIDCKASKFVLDHTEAETDEARASAVENLNRTMQNHMKQLASKNYLQAVRDHFRRSNILDDVSTAYLVMYVPSEQIVENLKRADPQFIHKMEQSGMMLASPLSLSSLCTMAGSSIAQARRDKEQEKIAHEITRLMDNVITLVEKVDKVGKGIRQASTGFNEMARSVNGTMLPKLKKLQQLGVSNKKALPSRVASYDMHEITETVVLEAEEDGFGEESAALLTYTKAGHA